MITDSSIQLTKYILIELESQTAKDHLFLVRR